MTRATVLLVVMLFGATPPLYAQGGMMPKALIDPYASSATAQLTVGEDGQVTAVPGHQCIAILES
jgi:hypothetical protein